jgi:hypothetical protein
LWTLLLPLALVVAADFATKLTTGPFTWLWTLVQLGLWSWAVVAAVRVLRPVAVKVIAAVVLVAGAVWFVNWAWISPAAYFEVHRGQFAYIATHPPSTNVDHYTGDRLPWQVRDVSVTWNATIDNDVIVVPAIMGFNDATGYVHVGEVPPPDGVVDLNGYGYPVKSCKVLSGGWRWC